MVKIALSEEEQDALSDREYRDMTFTKMCVENGSMSAQPIYYLKRS